MERHYIRKAKIADVRRIHQLLLESSKRGELLPRSFNSLYNNLRDFFVAVDDDSGTLDACCALTICWEDLGEVRSLVVDGRAQGSGLGTKLVEICLQEARGLGLARVFALTYVTDFFVRLGFSEVSKNDLPQKVWADCINCPQFPECDEVAMMHRLDVLAGAMETA